MSRIVPGLLLVLMLVAGIPGRCFALQEPAVISGTVRDVRGVPQIGTLVQLLRMDESTAASSMSDDHGRYIMPAVVPGLYRMRATAVFFVPLTKNGVRIKTGAQAVVNLTMTALFEADNWVPAQRRKASEAADDWKWTLRSTANRPLLRLVDPEDGKAIASSPDKTLRAASQGKIVVIDGDGAFGDGGLHQVVLLDTAMEDGGDAVLQTDVGEDVGGYAPGPSIAIDAGYERRTPMEGSTRLVANVQSHPELTDGRLTNGFQRVSLASTQQFALGDTFLFDVGALLKAERLSGTRIETEPFVRVTVRPSDGLVLEYRYASGMELQSSEDLDQLQPVLTVGIDGAGRPLDDRGMHQEVSVSGKRGNRVVTVFGYMDRLPYGAMGGSGSMNSESLRAAHVVADLSTGTFEVATPGYMAHGAGASLMQALTPGLSAWVELDSGTALQSGGRLDLDHLSGGVHPKMAEAVTFALRGKVARSDTWMRMEYRWQPGPTLSQVNAYNAVPQEAYLTFYVRQRLWCGRLLPDGVDGVLLATNLSKQGYQPVQAPDGQMLVLAEAPQVLQGGLSFNF